MVTGASGNCIANSINRTTFGIETYLRWINFNHMITLSIEPLLELKPLSEIKLKAMENFLSIEPLLELKLMTVVKPENPKAAYQSNHFWN